MPTPAPRPEEMISGFLVASGVTAVSYASVAATRYVYRRFLYGLSVDESVDEVFADFARNLTRLTLPCGDGMVGLLVHEQPRPRCTMIVFPGCRSTTASVTNEMGRLAALFKAYVIGVMYPGYDEIEGIPSVETLCAAAQVAVGRVPQEGHPLIIIGRSLGGGPAMAAASICRALGIVVSCMCIEDTFTTITELFLNQNPKTSWSVLQSVASGIGDYILEEKWDMRALLNNCAVTTPVVFARSPWDKSVRDWMMVELYEQHERTGNADAVFVRAPGDGHCSALFTYKCLREISRMSHVVLDEKALMAFGVAASQKWMAGKYVDVPVKRKNGAE